jgi:hypothetical protein
MFPKQSLNEAALEAELAHPFGALATSFARAESLCMYLDLSQCETAWNAQSTPKEQIGM